MSNETRPCDSCGTILVRKRGQFERTATGKNYCDLACSGQARRCDKTAGQKRTSKAAYDKRRRERLGEGLRSKKREAYYADHEESLAAGARHRSKVRADPERHAAYREQQRALAARPDWKAKKREYDRLRRASEYGELAGAFIALLELEAELAQIAKDEGVTRTIIRGTNNKAQEVGRRRYR